jgi:hypothetical protein
LLSNPRETIKGKAVMKVNHFLSVAVVSASLAALGIPALAESSGAADGIQSGSPNMHHPGQGMMSGGMMSRGCASMMQSMNNGGGRPNEQWRNRTPEARGMPQ